MMVSPAYGIFTDTSATGMAVRVPEPSSLSVFIFMLSVLAIGWISGLAKDSLRFPRWLRAKPFSQLLFVNRPRAASARPWRGI
jgi:hypothetical protein